MSRNGTRRAVRSATALLEFTRGNIEHIEQLLEAYTQSVERVGLLVPFCDPNAAIVEQTESDVASCRADIPRVREWIAARRAELADHERELKFLKLIA